MTSFTLSGVAVPLLIFAGYVLLMVVCWAVITWWEIRRSRQDTRKRAS